MLSHRLHGLHAVGTHRADLHPRLQVVLDGVFDQAPDGTVRFHEATGLTPDDWLALQRLVQRRVLRDHASRGALRTRGLLEEHDADGMPGTRRRRVGQGSGGFSIDASVHIQGDDRGGLERVIRGHRREALVAPGRRSPARGRSCGPCTTYL